MVWGGARTFRPRTFRPADISTTDNAKGGRFGHKSQLWVGGWLHALVHACMYHAFSICFLTCLLASQLIRTGTVFISACKYMHANN